MRSIWSINDIQKKDKREPLPEHISAAVIGGGMAGIRWERADGRDHG